MVLFPGVGFKVIVRVFAFVRTIVLVVEISPALTVMVPAEVNSKFEGAANISVPKVEISSLNDSVITMLPNIKEDVGKLPLQA